MRVFDGQYPFNRIVFDDLTIDGMREPVDVCTSALDRSIFVSDWEGDCVWKICVTDETVTPYSLTGKPNSMSIDNTTDLLILQSNVSVDNQDHQGFDFAVESKGVDGDDEVGTEKVHHEDEDYDDCYLELRDSSDFHLLTDVSLSFINPFYAVQSSRRTFFVLYDLKNPRNRKKNIGSELENFWVCEVSRVGVLIRKIELVYESTRITRELASVYVSRRE